MLSSLSLFHTLEDSPAHGLVLSTLEGSLAAQ